MDRILQRVATLSYGSERGTVRTELQGLRVIGLMHNVSVAFVTTEDAVVVHRILYGGRNWLAVPTEGDDS